MKGQNTSYELTVIVTKNLWHMARRENTAQKVNRKQYEKWAVNNHWKQNKTRQPAGCCVVNAIAPLIGVVTLACMPLSLVLRVPLNSCLIELRALKTEFRFLSFYSSRFFLFSWTWLLTHQSPTSLHPTSRAGQQPFTVFAKLENSVVMLL